MSFDLHFLSPEPGQSWEEAMEALEAAAEEERPLDDASLATWDRIKAAVTGTLPDATEHVGERHREVSDEATGIQLSMFTGELSLTLQYWYSGPDAERVVGLLREVVAAVEGATGLTAYDPQADAPFLGGGEHSAASTLDRTRRAVADVISRDADNPPTAETGRPSMWARLVGRGRS
jgi:hypothetical protein